MNAQQLQAAVEAALRENPRVDAREIEVRMADGTVILTGSVDSALEKRHARHAAEEVPGVRSVIDHLRVRNFVRRPDVELEEEIRHRLARDAFAPAGIEVYVSNGEVRLDGWARTYAERRAAEEVAWWTPGVTNVENLLLVTGEPFVDVSPEEVVDTA
ncbi:MAG: BON domain-containing protein [Armatimonadetes bacterium]|nr:BON domain-containing protein [Armatimonadota bacterium]